MFVTLFAFLLLREKISKNQILGLALDVVGIVLIIQPWHLKLDALGVTYIMLGTLLFALYEMCIRDSIFYAWLENGMKEDLETQIHRLSPVSYTHLDVYKRQIQRAPLDGWEKAR